MTNPVSDGVARPVDVAVGGQSLTPQRRVLLLVVLAVANFTAGMGGFVIVGLLNPLAENLNMTSAQAGWVMTSYAIAYAIGSPILVAVTGAWQRRTVLLVGMAVFSIATLATAMATTTSMLLLARVAVAMGAALITPVTAGVAIAVSQPLQTGKALATVFSGITISQALGIPAGSFIAYTWGWQSTFVVVSLLGVLTLLGVWRLVPPTLKFQPNSLHTLKRSLLDWQRMSAILFIASFLGSIYVIYTYFAPLLSQTMGYERNGVTALLLVFGVGAVVGNLLGGWMTDRFGPMKSLVALCVIQLLLMPLYSLLPMSDTLLFGLTFVWSVFGWAVAAPQQTRIVRHAPGSQNVALALHAAAIYIGVSAGAAAGGAVISAYGLKALGLAAALGMIAALVHLWWSERMVESAT